MEENAAGNVTCGAPTARIETPACTYGRAVSEQILDLVLCLVAQVRHRVERIGVGMLGFLEDAELRLLGVEFQLAKLCASIAATSPAPAHRPAEAVLFGDRGVVSTRATGQNLAGPIGPLESQFSEF
jgi:hypothetical protein